MRSTRLLLSFGISLFFLYLTVFIPQIGALFHGETGIGTALFGKMRFDFGQLENVIASASWLPIFGAGVLLVISLFVRAWRWRVVLNPVARMSFGDVFAAMCIGYMANDLLPFRMGELYRAHVVHQLSGATRSEAFGTIVLERVLDLVFMVPFMAMAILLYPVSPALRQGAIAIGIVTFAGAGFLIWMVLDRDRALALAERVLNILPRKLSKGMIHLLERFTAGLGVLKKSEHLFGLIFSSLLIWVMYAVMIWIVLGALGFLSQGYVAIDENPLGAVLAILMINTIGFVIPSAPGAVGTYHGMVTLGLSLMGIPGDRAAGFAILLHALNFIPLTGLGLIYFWKLGLTFSETKRLASEIEDDNGGSGKSPAPAEDSMEVHGR
jgi:glycosyltransferase 2 family protein